MTAQVTANCNDFSALGGTHVLMFSSKSCHPCIRAEAVLLSVINAAASHVEAAVFDVDANSKLANSLNVRAVPSLFLIKDGRVLDTRLGTPTRTSLLNWLKQLGE